MAIKEIKTIGDIITVIREADTALEDIDWLQYGQVNVKREGTYLLFNYKAEAQYENRWNAFERMSRGLIIDAFTETVMARPFDKFFNWGTHMGETDSPISYVMDKMDGSLGICWFDHRFGGWRITTRGSFDSDQGRWATNFLHRKLGKNHGIMNGRLTYLFEIIYPDNRIVVDYGKEQNLYLLAARHNETGGYVFRPKVLSNVAKAMGVECAKYYTAGFTPEQVIHRANAKKGTEAEGFVTVHMDGSRWKFKGEDYVRIHRVISNFSFKHTLDAMMTNTFQSYIEGVPDEFLEQIKTWQHAIVREVHRVARQAAKAKAEVEHLGQRRDQAEVLLSKHKEVASYAFAMLDDKFSHTMIFKKHDFSHLEEITDV